MSGGPGSGSASPINDSFLTPGAAGEQDPSRLSSASSFYGVLSGYRLSTASALSDNPLDPTYTSARRNSSPIPFHGRSSPPGSPGLADDGGGSRLHRRSSSRRRDSDEEPTEPAPSPRRQRGSGSSSSASASGDTGGDGARAGWRLYESTSPADRVGPPPPWATESSDPRHRATAEDRRGSTGSVIRPLPREPGHKSRSSTLASTTSTVRPLPVPERSSSFASTSHSISNIQPTSSSSISRGVSITMTPPQRQQNYADPFGVNQSRDSIWTLDSPPLDNEFDETVTARSPLQPAFDTPASQSKSFTRKYPNGHAETSSSLGLGLSNSDEGRATLAVPGAGLGRRKSITAAVDVVRRMSVRVVNFAGAPTENILEPADPPRSPGGAGAVSFDDSESGFPLPTINPPAGDSDSDDDTRAKVETTALTGYTLGVLGPRNWIRRGCAKALQWKGTEPLILVLIVLSVVLLTIQASPDVYTHPRPTKGYLHSWEDYVLFALYCCFTVEIIARIVVSGLVVNPAETIETVYSQSPGQPSLSPSISITNVKDTNPFDAMRARLSPAPSPTRLSTISGSYPPTKDAASYRHSDGTLAEKESFYGSTAALVPKGTSTISVPMDPNSHSLRPTKAHTPFIHSVRRQRTTYQQAFLRHSWNRLDAIAVVAFWITFVLATFGLENRYNLTFIRALSVLRATRLLAITEGTTTILQSLKGAAPQLVQVAFFVVFAMALFSIVGIQAFSGSYRRSCQWIDPTGQFDTVNFESQHCGGYYDSSGLKRSYVVNSTGLHSTESPKGFLCPSPSMCLETTNPDHGAISFDNIFTALLQIVIVASANTWTTIMFEMMDADFFVSCLFFIVCLIVLNYWLINLFVAVITAKFGAIMEDTKHSAFARTTVNDTVKAAQAHLHSRVRRGQSLLRKLYKATRYFWIALIVVDIGIQASATAFMSDQRAQLLDSAERYLTFAFALEMVIRAGASLPDWRIMFTDRQNAVDLCLAVITCIIQIPAIRQTRAYDWLTFFQIARFYRVILAIPRTKNLLIKVLGTFTGLMNMILFMIMMTFIAGLMAVQMFRGLPNIQETEVTSFDFFQIYNGFLTMYQLLSSENWTDPLHTVLAAETGIFQLAVAALFLAGWMLFAFFILVNMFIAVLNENYTVAEEVKHQLQLEEFFKRSEPPVPKTSRFYVWLDRINPYRFMGQKQHSPISHHVRDFLASEVEERPSAMPFAPQFTTRARRVLGMEGTHEHAPVTSAAPADTPSYSYAAHLKKQSDYIVQHPSYDRSLWVFSQGNFLRRLCQRLVDPPTGDGIRLGGRRARTKEKTAFKMLIFAAIVGSVTVAGIATPVYRKAYFTTHGGETRDTWFNLVEVSLGFVFVVEFLVKVIADGFVYSPQAYLLSMWNGLDLVVLITLVVNVVSALVNPSGMNRVVRALKACRPLRLISLSPTVRQTFYKVLILGAGRIFDASLLALLYIIPYAVWAQNVFSGLLFFCNDSSVTTKAECAGEFLNSAVSDWQFPMPRVWANPYVWTFDSFRGSFLILFEIISLEGWINVLQSSMQITGRDQQPVTNASQFSGLFFLAYNLVGAAFILTLFVSVIIEGFARRSGMSLLTTEQRQWLDLRKLISRQRPSKRPRIIPSSVFRRWCFDRAAQKHGWWSKSMTGVFAVHIVLLMTQAYGNPTWVNTTRNYLFLAVTLIYTIDVLVRMIGLGWSYSRDYWGLFDVIVVAGTVATTILVLTRTTNQVAIQMQKLFLVLIALKLVQKINSLNQLFKTAAASLPAIVNIFALWLVLFLVWAIAYLEVFSLTRWGPNGTWNANYSTFWTSMVMLVLASTGEGWNGFMHDYTVEYPHCTASTNHLDSDCGSAGWAFTLFISWNVLSMYLMSNLILGAVVENFGYVFQVYGGKVKSINREQMRSFKKAWGQVDKDRTGFIQDYDIPRFLAKLSGVFEVRIYREKWSLHRLMSLAAVGERGDPNREVDVAKLALLLAQIDPEEVQRRKRRYNQVYHEAMLEAQNDERGISFNIMLLLLAHHCLVNDVSALSLDEKLERREKTQNAFIQIHADSVRGFLRRLILRRQHTQNVMARERSRAGAPQIVVHRHSTASSLDGPHSPDTSN